jgi:hypothetical protein
MRRDYSSLTQAHEEFRRAQKTWLKRNTTNEDANSEKTKSYAQVALSVEHKIVQREAGGLKSEKSRLSHIGIRLSESEREIVVQQAEQSRLTISEYVRASVLGAGYISTIDPVKRELLQRVSRELGRQGNNLNQIAKHLNSGAASPEQGDSMLAMIARSLLSAYQSVRKALAEGRSYD